MDQKQGKTQNKSVAKGTPNSSARTPSLGMETALGSLDGLELEGWAIRVNLTQGRNPDIIHQHFGIILSFLEVMIQLN